MAVHYHEGMIWVAGGGPQFGADTAIPEVCLYDPMTGTLKLSCLPNDEATTTNFINDMTFANGKVYATNSFRNSIMVLDEAAVLNGECVVDAIPTPVELFLPTEFGANGIVFYNDGLIIAQRTSGGVYFLDLDDSNRESELLRVNTSVTADGFALSATDDTLYLGENINEKSMTGLVSAWQLRVDKDNSNVPTMSLLGNIISPDYDSPATLTLTGDDLYTVNGRFASVDFFSGIDAEPGFSERFQVVGVDRLDFEKVDESSHDDNAASSTPRCMMLGAIVAALSALLF